MHFFRKERSEFAWASEPSPSIKGDWLHHIAYDQLLMLNVATAEERRRLGNHAAFKAQIYASQKEAQLFIESEDAQAQEIFERTGKPVFCVDSQQYYCDHRREARIVKKRKLRGHLAAFVHRYWILRALNHLRKRCMGK